MEAPHLVIQMPPPPVGAYWIGGFDNGLAFTLSRRPHWWHRLMMRWAFGWHWRDERMNAIHEQEIELKRREPVGIQRHRVTVYVDLADIARRYGPRAAATLTGRVRLLEGAVIIEKMEGREP